MKRESGLNRSVIDEIDSSDIQRDQMECESCLTRIVIDEVDSQDI